MSRSPDDVYYGYISSKYEGALGPLKPSKFCHVEVPLKHTFWPTWIPGYPQTHNRFTLIKLATDDGVEGYSAGIAMGTERQGLGDLLGSYLLGTDPTDIDRVQSLLKQAGFLGWRNFWLKPASSAILGKH